MAPNGSPPPDPDRKGPPPEAAYAKPKEDRRRGFDPPTVNLSNPADASRIRCFTLGSSRYPNCRPETACNVCVKYKPATTDTATRTPTTVWNVPVKDSEGSHTATPGKELRDGRSRQRKFSRLTIAIVVVAGILLLGVIAVVLWAHGIFGPIG